MSPWSHPPPLALTNCDKRYKLTMVTTFWYLRSIISSLAHYGMVGAISLAFMTLGLAVLPVRGGKMPGIGRASFSLPYHLTADIKRHGQLSHAHVLGARSPVPLPTGLLYCVAQVRLGKGLGTALWSAAKSGSWGQLCITLGHQYGHGSSPGHGHTHGLQW